MPVHFIIGGARSGKSRHAEQLAAATQLPVTYIATAQPGDAEMAARIAHHRRQRPAHWVTVEAPVLLAQALRAAAAPQQVVVVDCLTLWLTNVLLGSHGDAVNHDEALPPALPPLFTEQRAALLDTLPQLPGQIIVVSNEIGWGVVPMGAITRLFVDEMGRLNQAVAALATQVTLAAAGLPLQLK